MCLGPPIGEGSGGTTTVLSLLVIVGKEKIQKEASSRVRDDNEWINEYWYLNTVGVLYNQEESGVKIFFMKGEMLQYSVRENV